MERKLTAILSADVKGYSRLMGEDEEATIRTLTAYRQVMTTLIAQHRGRVVDSPGDNLLAEFASAVDAVQGAVEIQRELKAKNTDLPDSRKMEYRIGINVGDVIVEGERLYGDGVNIAARLEGLAESGGICISGTVYDQVKNKVALGYEYLGEQEVKNIAEPVRVYRLVLEVPSPLATADQLQSRARQQAAASPLPHGRGSDAPPFPQGEKGPTSRKPWRVVGTVGLVLLAGTLIAVWFLFFPTPSTQHPIPNTQSLPLPDKPSIAVLPFTNMSGDPGQEYFSDGMTEDIITDLSKFSGLFVVARNSTFTYKGKAADVKNVGQELGVRYVLEGSVQKAGNRVRINTQLIDATTGGHMWAERYDRELHDLFALQDEITQEITRSLRVEVQEAERARVRRIPTANLTAYDAWLRGVEHYWRITNDDNAQARQLFERAIELDPQYAEAYAWLGLTYWLEWVWKVDSHLFERAGEFAQHALTLDDALPDAHMLLGHVYLWQKKQPKQAIVEGERAIALDPNHALAHVMLADILCAAGRAEEAIGLVHQAMRLNPRYPAYYPFILGAAYSLVGQHDEAMAASQEAVRLNPNDPSSYLLLSGIYLTQWIGQWSQDPQTLERAVEVAQQGVALSDSVDWTHGALSGVYLWQKQHEKALAEAERTVALNPTEAESHANVGNVLNFAGRPDITLKRMEQVTCATAFFGPHFCLSVLGDACYLTGRYEEAIGAFQQALRHPPRQDLGLFVHLGLAASYSEMGRADEARAEISAVLKINPQFSLEGIRQRWPYKDPAMLERVLAALQKAGLK